MRSSSRASKICPQRTNLSYIRFVTERGGALILVPDAAVPERLRALFELPRLEPALLERPVPVLIDQTRILASELLFVAAEDRSVKPIARVKHGSAERTAIFAAYRGNGQVVVSGALDAWRFRGAPETSFAALWQGLIADAAGSAVPRVSVEVEPMLTRPGEEVTLRVRVRETEWVKSADHFQLPAVSASVASASGSSDSRAPLAGDGGGRVPGALCPAGARQV